MRRHRTRRRLSTFLVALTAALSLLAPVMPATAAATPGDPAAAAAQVEPAVVRIDTVIDYQRAVGAGTGVVLSPNGEVLTNFHVVQGADLIRATVGGRAYQADLLGYDRGQDVAVLQLLGAGGLPAAAIGDSNLLVEGDPVVALGNSQGTDAPVVREVGTVTAFGRSVTAEDTLTGSEDHLTGLIEFAAPVRAGDSGGPLVNAFGQVVGVTTAASVNYRMGPGGKGFAIPINDAMGAVGQIRSRIPSNSVHIGPPTMLGVGVLTVPQPDVPGVIVRDVIRGGPAEAAGMMGGDVLLSVDGVRLDSATALTYLLDRHYPGDVVDLTWLDAAGQQLSGKATLV